MADNQNGSQEASPSPNITDVMGNLPTPDAAEMARVAKRWMEARKRDEIRKARAERWKKRMWKVRQAIAVPWKRLEWQLELIGRRIRSPFDDILLKIEAWQDERRQKQIAYLKSMEPQREAAARKRWEKRQKRSIAFAMRWAVWRERLSVVGGLIVGVFRRFESFQEDTKNFFLAPYREMLLKREQIVEERRKKIAELMNKDKGLRDEKVRAKHMKMMEKMMIRKERAARRRERLEGVYSAMRTFGKFWRDTAPIRKLIYIIILLYAAFHYRAVIITKIGGVFGFDLQRLMD